MKKQVNIFNYFSGVQYLRDYFEEMKAGNPRLSLRSFAAKLGLDQSTLSRYFAGERHISSEKATDIALRLKLEECESQYLKLLFLLGDRGEKELLEKIKLSFLYDQASRALACKSPSVLEKPDLARGLKAHVVFECQKLNLKSFTPEELSQRLNKNCEMDPGQVSQVLSVLAEKDSSDKDPQAQNRFSPQTSEVGYHREALLWALKACDQLESADLEFQTYLVPIKKENRPQVLRALQHLSALLNEQAVEENADDLFLVSSFMVNLTKI